MSFAIGNTIGSNVHTSLHAAADATEVATHQAEAAQAAPSTTGSLATLVPPGGLHPVVAAATSDTNRCAGSFIVVCEDHPGEAPLSVPPEGGGFSGFLHTVSNLMRGGGSPG